MANQEHLDILQQGVETWNQWRKEHADISPDLNGANLSFADLNKAHLSGAHLSGADLANANFTGGSQTIIGGWAIIPASATK